MAGAFEILNFDGTGKYN